MIALLEKSFAADGCHGSGLSAISGYDLLRLDFDVYICPDGERWLPPGPGERRRDAGLSDQLSVRNLVILSNWNQL